MHIAHQLTVSRRRYAIYVTDFILLIYMFYFHLKSIFMVFYGILIAYELAIIWKNNTIIIITIIIYAKCDSLCLQTKRSFKLFCAMDGNIQVVNRSTKILRLLRKSSSPLPCYKIIVFNLMFSVNTNLEILRFCAGWLFEYNPQIST